MKGLIPDCLSGSNYLCNDSMNLFILNYYHENKIVLEYLNFAANMWDFAYQKTHSKLINPIYQSFSW